MNMIYFEVQDKFGKAFRKAQVSVGCSMMLPVKGERVYLNNFSLLPSNYEDELVCFKVWRREFNFDSMDVTLFLIEE